MLFDNLFTSGKGRRSNQSIIIFCRWIAGKDDRMKRVNSEQIQAAVLQYLKRRNYIVSNHFRIYKLPGRKKCELFDCLGIQ